MHLANVYPIMYGMHVGSVRHQYIAAISSLV